MREKLPGSEGKMGRKSRYCKEISEVICDAIARNGGDESGWLAGGISAWTFYDWIRKYPQFSQAVERARADFRNRATEQQRLLAAQRLNEALESGQIIKWKAKKTTRRDHFVPQPDGEDVLAWYQVETEESTREERRPTPQWAIERVLPKPLYTLDQLVAIAGEYGLALSIKDADLFNRYLAEIACTDEDETDSGKGISEDAADMIRSQILGMSE